MRLGMVQMALAVTIIVVALLAQVVPIFESGPGGRRARPSEPIFGEPSRALAQDDDNEDGDNDDEDDEDDDNDDADNEDEDNEDEDEDNEDDGDDDNDDGDNDEDEDNEEDGDDDNEDGDNDDADNDDADNEDADNDDEDSDNDDEDSDNDDADNEDDEEDADNWEYEADNGGDDGGDSGEYGDSFDFDPSVTEATGTSTGGDSEVGLPSGRVLVRIFPWMPRGVSLTVRLADPSVAAGACTVVDGLVFELVADDGSGYLLTELPAEVNLSARYANRRVSRDGSQVATLYWLDPSDDQWKTAPKQVRSASTNYVAASITALGTYAVCQS